MKRGAGGSVWNLGEVLGEARIRPLLPTYKED